MMSSWMIMPDGTGVRLDGNDLVDPIEAVRYETSINAVIVQGRSKLPRCHIVMTMRANHDPGDEDRTE
jgi:hypothetical protein